MKDLKGKFNNAKDKTTGKMAEAAGKITNNGGVELKGKLLSKKVDFKKKIAAKGYVKEAEVGAIGKLNDMIDKKDKKGQKR